MVQLVAEAAASLSSAQAIGPICVENRTLAMVTIAALRCLARHCGKAASAHALLQSVLGYHSQV